LPKRTKLSTCARKRRFKTEAAAVSSIVGTGITLRSYRCDRCHHFHLTSRTKGKPCPRAMASPAARL
jgi:hypothetical protein